jgi:methionyl-tRNA synthetase
MYVWFDALGNYITALGYGGDEDGAAYRTFWVGNGERLHVIGKGILRFHAVYWPAMLLAAGLPLPTAVFVHGYFTVEGQKMSKSVGNVVDPQDVIAQYGAAALRWYLLREVHPTADADFNVARVVARYNTDLANDLGNLLNRVNAMLHRYRGGVVPETDAIVPPADDLATLAVGLPARVAAAMDAFDPRAALDAVWELVVRGNRAVDEAAPWVLHRAEAAGDAGACVALDGVLYALLETVRLVAVHLDPFLPGSAARILEQLGVPTDAERPHGERVCWGGLPPGTRTAAPAPLFPRLEAASTVTGVLTET